MCNDSTVGAVTCREDVTVDVTAAAAGSYFPDWLLERRKRAERALTAVVATCYLLGVSTRRMDNVGVEAFRTRPLDAGPYAFVAADALVLKVSEAVGWSTCAR